MRARYFRFLSAVTVLCVSSVAFAQTTPSTSGPVKITLDDAIQMALQHNHNLLAQRTVVQQNQAEEITANLRPNPVLSGDAQFLPIFQPDKFSADYINTTAQFDVGLGYLFERGRKRQHRLQAARDVTEQSRFTVADNERSLDFSRGLAVYRRAGGRIHDRSRCARLEEFSKHGGHQRKPL